MCLTLRCFVDAKLSIAYNFANSSVVRFVGSQGGKKSQSRATFKLGGVSINAKSVLQAISDLEPLARIMPTNTKERERY